MLKDFKAFIMRGNVVDMAVGVIIGAAFGKITASLVEDVIMPPIGILLGKVDFTSLALTLTKGADGKPVQIKYGIFINTLLNFLIVAGAVFLLVKAVEKLKHKEEAKPAEAATKECPKCVSMIAIKAVKCPNCTADLA